jgi:hypothetical protein
MIKLFISGVGMAVALGIFFMYTQPTYDKTQVLTQEIDRYNQALDKAAELQQLKQSLLSRYNAFNPEDLVRLQKLLPDHVDNVRLILDLDNLAKKHDMSLQSVTISGPRSETAGNASSLGAIGASQQKFDSLTLQFSTEATYPVFKQFLGELESSLRIVDLVTLTLSPRSSAAGSNEPTYSFNITIRTYWLR